VRFDINARRRGIRGICENIHFAWPDSFRREVPHFEHSSRSTNGPVEHIHELMQHANFPGSKRESARTWDCVLGEILHARLGKVIRHFMKGIYRSWSTIKNPHELKKPVSHEYAIKTAQTYQVPPPPQ
jgi:hypothetical protein